MRVLRIPKYAAVGILESLWHLTARETPAGNIGKLTDEDIAITLDWGGDAEQLITALVSVRWVDEDPIHRLAIHDWSEHSDDATDARLARAGEKYADGSNPRGTKLGRKERERLSTDDTAARGISRQPSASDGSLPEPEPEPEPSRCQSLAKPAPQTDSGAGDGEHLDELVRAVVCAHPKSVARKLTPHNVRQADEVAVLEAIGEECRQAGCSRREAAEMLLQAARNFAEIIPRSEWRYLKDVAEFYRNFEYRRSPEDFISGARPNAGTQNRSQQRTNGNLAAFASFAEKRGIDLSGSCSS